MNYKKLSLLFKICCAVLLIGSIALLTLTLNNYANSNTITIDTRQAQYYSGAGSPVLVVGSDANALASTLPLLRDNNRQVLSLPYADLSTADYQQAVLQLGALSGLPSNDLLVVAHGDAADSVIRWYFDSSTPIKSLILISPDTDSTNLLEGGVYSCSFPSAAKILIIDSATMPTEQINRSTELYNLLSGDTIKSNGNPFKANKGNVSMLLAPGSVLYDSPVSFNLLEQLSSWLGSNLNVPSAVSLTLKVTPLLWLIVTIALGGFLYTLLLISKSHYAPEVYQIVSASIPHPWKFGFSRIIIAVISLLVALILFLLASPLKLPVGVFGRSFMSYTVACGAVILLLYRRGWMPGVKGSPTDSKVAISSVKLLQILGITIAVALSLFALGYSGFYTIGFTPVRGILFLSLWVLYAIALRSISYDISLIEEISYKSNAINSMLLMPYLPVLGLVALAVPMGELSMAIAMLKCTFVLICAIILNRITDMLTGSARLAASLSALILAGFLSFYLYI